MTSHSSLPKSFPLQRHCLQLQVRGLLLLGDFTRINLKHFCWIGFQVIFFCSAEYLRPVPCLKQVNMLRKPKEEAWGDGINSQSKNKVHTTEKNELRAKSAERKQHDKKVKPKMYGEYEAQEIAQKLSVENKDLKHEIRNLKNLLREETGMRRDFSDKYEKEKQYRQRALVAEKHIEELQEQNEKYKREREAFLKKTVKSTNEAEKEKAEKKNVLEALKKSEHMNENLKLKSEFDDIEKENLKEKLVKIHKLVEEARLEIKQTLKNEAITFKRLQLKDDQNISLRKEIMIMKKVLREFESNKKKQEYQHQKMKEELERVHTVIANLEKENEMHMESSEKLKKEIADKETELSKIQAENHFLKNQTEQFKNKLNDIKTVKNKIETTSGKQTNQTKEELNKLMIQKEEIETRNQRLKEASCRHERKINHLGDIIRTVEGKCKNQTKTIARLRENLKKLHGTIAEQSKEIVRLNGDAQKFQTVKETYWKVETLWQNDEKQDHNTKKDPISALLMDNNKLSYKLREKQREIEQLQDENKRLANECAKVEQLQFENEKLQHDVEKGGKLQQMQKDVVLKLHESQKKIRDLKTNVQCLTAENNAYMAANKRLENELKMKNELSKSPQKRKLPPVFPLPKIVKSNCEDKSEESLVDSQDPKPTLTKTNIVYLPPITPTPPGKKKKNTI